MAKTKKSYDGSTRLKSPMQEAFVAKLLEGMPQQTALTEAGYKTKTPEVSASRLVRNDKVALRLAYKREQLAKKFDISAERVVAELAKVGFSNIQDFIKEGNNIVDLTQIDRKLVAAVESVQSDIRHDSGDSEGYTEKVKIKLHSKLGALNSLAEILKLKDVAGKTEIKILQIGGLQSLEA